MAEFKIGPGETRREVILRLGEDLTLRLDENPTTGFRWAADPSSSEVVQLKTSNFVAAGSSGVGGGGERTMVFHAKSKGTAALSLLLRQEWRAGQPDRRVLLAVTVN